MNWDPTTLLRPGIQRMTAYRSARSETAASHVSIHLHLDANESPWSGSDQDSSDNRYPEPQPASVLSAASAFYGCAPDRILLTRGIDEGLDTLIRAFCEPGRDAILIHPPTYGFYEVAAAIQGCAVITAPLDPSGFTLRVDRIAKAIDSRTKMVILCNPNNPTGNRLDAGSIEEVIALTATRGVLLVIDEAYIEFSAADSMVSRAARFPHVLVLRTFSKAFGLAGLRTGATLADARIIAALRKVLAPYPLPRPTVRSLEAALEPLGIARMERRVQELLLLRDGLAENLAALPGISRVLASATNFLMVEVEGPAEQPIVIQKALWQRGISIRDRSSDVPGALRITVGTETENLELIAALKEILS